MAADEGKEEVMINKHVTVEWIRELIRSGKVQAFYNTREWHELRERKRRAEHFECERCRARGIHSQAYTVHHRKYLRRFPELAMSYDNLELLCEQCHYEEPRVKNRKFFRG